MLAIIRASIGHALPAGSLLAALAFNLAVAPPALAEIYKWTDADGKTVYSEKPPPGGAATVVNPHAGKASPEAQERLRSTIEQSRQEDEADQATEAETAATDAKAKEKKHACEQARVVLEQLTRSTRMQYVDENNERAFLSEEQRQSRLRDANEKIKEYCS